MIDTLWLYLKPRISSSSGEARPHQPGAVHGVAGHHDEGPAADAHHAGQPAVRPHILQLIHQPSQRACSSLEGRYACH